MSAAQTQNDNEQRWSCLESLGLSPRELVLAEALQMEYDALSRLKQDKDPAGRGESESSKTMPSRNTHSRRMPSPSGTNLHQGLSGSDPILNLIQPGVSSPSRSNVDPQGYSKEPLYILENPGKNDYERMTEGISKGLPPPDEPPPAIPPRNPIPQADSFHLCRGSAPRDVNLFTPEVDQPKLSSGETLNYDNLNDSLMRLTSGRQSPRQQNDQSGKPVARSKTLPPQVPPRTYLPGPKSARNNRRVSADPVSLHSRMNSFGYELFQVSEERDEEVAAFCHMLDVLRSAYPCTDRSKNAGFVWSPCVAQEELQQGLGVSIKVTVIGEHIREPLIFTCDGSSTIDVLIYQTLCYAHDDLDLVDVDDYLMKVCGQAEYLNNSQTLAGLEYIQQCLKFDWDVRLFLTKRSSVNMELARTEEDDEAPSSLNHSILLQERPIKQTVTREALTLLLDTFHNEAESFVLSEADLHLHVERLVQSVKALCSTLAAVETPDITSALNQLPACPCRFQPRVQKCSQVQCVLENLPQLFWRL